MVVFLKFKDCVNVIRLVKEWIVKCEFCDFESVKCSVLLLGLEVLIEKFRVEMLFLLICIE